MIKTVMLRNMPVDKKKYDPLVCWIFNADVIESSYKTGNYSEPVMIKIEEALSLLAAEKNMIKLDFFVYSGDVIIGLPFFGVAVSRGLPAGCLDIITEKMIEVKGYMHFVSGKIPDMPLVQMCQYSKGKIYKQKDL